MANGIGYRLTRVKWVEMVSRKVSIVTLDCGHETVRMRPLHAGMRVYCSRHRGQWGDAPPRLATGSEATPTP